MNERRVLLIAVLFFFPLVCFAVVGAYSLWELGRLTWLWWMLPLCWGAGYLLARRRKPPEATADPSDSIPMHWTARDKNAWSLVQRKAAEAPSIPPGKLTDPQHYWETARALSMEVASFYHPSAKDPISSLTVPEILAAAQLVLEDLAELVDSYVPASRQLTVRRWRSLAKAPDYYNTASQVSYLISVLFGPASAASRFLASRLVLGPALEMVQQNLLVWFYTNFIHRVGAYAIEMNSRRLIGGAKRWKEEVVRSTAVGPVAEIDPEQAAAQPKPAPTRNLTIGVVGQVKAGKSSLINAFLGDRLAATDVLPATNSETRYELHDSELPDALILVDTVGYSVDGQGDAEYEHAIRVVRNSDLVFFVLDAVNPAREPDLRFLRRMDEWFVKNPQYKRPPILGVLTHIDGLSPRMEWSPPYEGWREEHSNRPKEKAIREAVQYSLTQLRAYLVDVVPVCTDADRNRVYGVDEWLFPEVTALLDEARAVLLVRRLHEVSGWDKMSSTFKQLRNAGVVLLRAAADFTQKP